MATVTAPVAGAATPKAAKGNLTHLCILDQDNRVAATYCGAAKPSSILHDMSQWTQQRPTCAACARHYDRHHA